MFIILNFYFCSSFKIPFIIKKEGTGKQGDAGLPCDRHIWKGRKRSLEPSGDINICKMNVYLHINIIWNVPSN